jgi:predicted metal-dependent phosphoesterase TrpH
MDLVTVSDHDSIDSVEVLRRHPDFFLSEEVTCRTPSGTELHMGVYGIDEKDHEHLQRRRDDLPALIGYLEKRNLFFSINHVFSSLTGRRTDADFLIFETRFPGIEVLNGQVPAFCNRSAAQLAERWSKTAIAGSDAHTLAWLGATYTEVPGARSTAEFLHGLRQGFSRTHGLSGNYWKLTRAVCEIGVNLVRERSWAIVLAPLFLAVPFVTLVNCLKEFHFDRKWSRRLLGAPIAVPPACAPESAV